MNVSDLIVAVIDQKIALETERSTCFNIELKRQLAIRIYLLGTTIDHLNELLNAGVTDIKISI